MFFISYSYSKKGKFEFTLSMYVYLHLLSSKFLKINPQRMKNNFDTEMIRKLKRKMKIFENHELQNRNTKKERERILQNLLF
jgi:hypothetical protein